MQLPRIDAWTADTETGRRSLPARLRASIPTRLARMIEQPDVDELLRRHAASVARLRELCAADLSTEHDDLWLLRYVLSYADEGAERQGAAAAALR